MTEAVVVVMLAVPWLACAAGWALWVGLYKMTGMVRDGK